jgi:hypothetical protein
MSDLRIQPFRDHPYKKDKNSGYDSRPAKRKSYFLFIDIPKENKTGSNQNCFDCVHHALGNIEEGTHIDADSKNGKGDNIRDIRSFLVCSGAVYKHRLD